jgi:GTPase SAR1 family protein
LIEWLKEIKTHASEDVRVYLIGNKSELEDEREVTLERAVEFAKAHNINKVFETSAKTGFNVEEVFACVGKELYL